MRCEIAGARAEVEDPEAVLRSAQEWASAEASEVSLIDAWCVFGADHLRSAVLHAERARDAGGMAAKTLAMEVLRYVSGRRQVSDAIRTAGLRRGTTAVAIVVIGEGPADELVTRLAWSRDDGVLLAEGKDVAQLGVTAREASTLAKEKLSEIALERVALLDVLK